MAAAGSHKCVDSFVVDHAVSMGDGAILQCVGEMRFYGSAPYSASVVDMFEWLIRFAFGRDAEDQILDLFLQDRNGLFVQRESL